MTPGNVDVGSSDEVGPVVHEIMTARVVAIGRSATLHEALAVMLGARVRHLPIVDDGKCVGLLYESDALWELYLHGELARTAGECARSPVPFVPFDASLSAAAQVFESAAADAVVVDRAGRIAGILTATDVVRATARARVQL
ncbi:CBS domain-containing protein [Antrihabitans sp. YC3-6]|uniref:CBS domain-containing protein n=1 Tax=Antrihabitans stalagmiti TaxID=2799499 RepID=A0A934U5X2_9NOCA|nr:CBS domain-containing protein [Antrihabitans stalagmiti]MBJ8341328.1 CBS domain-containing protein [Antrihabitans stalagmiti]